MDHSLPDQETEPNELDALKEAYSQAQKKIEELRAQVGTLKIYVWH